MGRRSQKVNRQPDPVSEGESQSRRGPQPFLASVREGMGLSAPRPGDTMYHVFISYAPREGVESARTGAAVADGAGKANNY
jgi:hypothetical protein